MHREPEEPIKLKGLTLETSLPQNIEKVFDVLYDDVGKNVSLESIAIKTCLPPCEILETAGYIKDHWGHISINNRDNSICMHKAPEELLSIIIRQGLEGSITGKNILCFSVLDSTNSMAKKLALKGAPEGTTVLTEHQTRGKGRMERTWESPAGVNILCSIILYPPLDVASVFKLTMIASVATVTAIEKTTSLKPRIKWPNDVYINNRKVCGILSEVSSSGSSVEHVILGIGINVNFDTSPYHQIRDTATSLMMEKGRKISRISLLKNLLIETGKRYQELLSGDTTGIRRDWKQKCMVLGKQVRIISGESEISGIARDITENGHLVLERNNALKEIVFGDLSLRMDPAHYEQ